MSNLEFLERLPAAEEDERWLVRAPGHDAPRIVCVFSDDEPGWLEAMADGTRPWIDFAHPRVAKVLEVGWRDKLLVITIDDDRGPTLASAAAQLAETPIDRERWVVAQFVTLADALASMAQRSPGFLHRRIEPATLFVDATGHARLRAPIASVSHGPQRGYMGAGRITGTARWMSPEQARGIPLTPATDVFSLASNLAFALTGIRPFDGPSELDALTAIINGPTPTPQTHAPGLDTVVARAFAKDPRERYPDPAAFATALYACVPDAADYDACTSDRIAAWWPTAKSAVRTVAVLGDRCKQAWETMTPGASGDIRHCGSCQQSVVRVASLAAVLPLLGRRCVYVPGR